MSDHKKEKKMTSIELMVEEHKYIVRMLEVVRKICVKVLNEMPVPYDDFANIILFIKEYADLHHHGKEEKFLFQEMVEQLGAIGKKLVINGMLVEHDWGRLFISELQVALQRVQDGDEDSKVDVIANAIGYANHLQRHIKKEDELIYVFAEKNLPEDSMRKIEDLTKNYEKEASEQGIQEKYLAILQQLEKKYMG